MRQPLTNDLVHQSLIEVVSVLERDNDAGHLLWVVYKYWDGVLNFFFLHVFLLYLVIDISLIQRGVVVSLSQLLGHVVGHCDVRL